MDALDLVKESRCLTVSESRKELELFDNLGEIRKQEEIYLETKIPFVVVKRGG